MKKQSKKTGQNKTGKNDDAPKVKRSRTATGVNENQHSIFPKRSPFADEMGTDIPDPNKVTR